MTNIEAMNIAMNRIPTQDKEKQIDFIQRIRTRRQSMKQTAEDIIEKLDLPLDSKYDILSIIYTSPPFCAEQATEKGQSKTIVPLKASRFHHTVIGASAYDDDSGVDSVLTQLDEYIRMVAWKSLQDAALSGLLDLEVDELVQTVRIKLWLTLQKKHIMSLKAYIRAIAHSEAIDLIRTAKRYAASPLPLDRDGELYQGHLLTTLSEGMGDPAYEVEQKETVADIIAYTVSVIISLPPFQQYAIICAIKDQAEDLLPLIEASFRLHQVDIEKIHWPESQADMHRLKASLSIARKKLRSLQRRYRW